MFCKSVVSMRFFFRIEKYIEFQAVRSLRLAFLRRFLLYVIQYTVQYLMTTAGIFSVTIEMDTFSF